MALILALVAVLFATAVAAVPLARRGNGHRVVYALCGTAALAIAALALARLLALDGLAPEAAPEVVLPLGLPWLGARFRLDALAAFFLVVVNLGAAAASLYALGYGSHERTPGRVLPFYPAFLAAMTLVVAADDAFSFLLCWEAMSLASWALVMANHRNPANAHAGYVYLVMAGFGTLALLLAFAVLAGPAGSYGFAGMRAATPAAPVAALALLLALVGAGSKAGLVPLHVWLPLAHPAAPSHVSALMSGVMTKVAVYAFIRIAFDLAGEPAWWWSVPVLTLGAGTAVFGVLSALMQNDLKRLLAYSTVENIGIVFIGLGLALAFRANGLPGLAALALVAALFHALNHMLFKSLLFMGAGAVQVATGERDMDRLGGLIHRMPLTAFAVLAGSTAIAALPPLNGFVSEWLTFQAILASPAVPQWGLRFLVPAVGAVLAFSAALAAACFVKAFGIAFLGRARSAAAAAATETDRFSLAAMLACAALCLLAGVLPGFVVDALAPVTALFAGATLPSQQALPWLSLVPLPATGSAYNGLVVLAFVALSALGAALVLRRLGSTASRRVPAWDCGFPDADPATQYTSGSIAQPIRRVFGSVAFAARERVDMPAPGETKPARFELRLRDLIWETAYRPLAGAVDAIAERTNRAQFLTVRRYLGLVFGALVALLVVLAVAP